MCVPPHGFTAGLQLLQSVGAAECMPGPGNAQLCTVQVLGMAVHIVQT